MSVELVKEYFKQWNLEDQVMEFSVSSATVGEAALAVGCEEKEIAKTLSFKVEEQPILIVAAGDAKIDNAKYKSVELNEENVLFVNITKSFEKGQTVAPLAVNTLGENAEKVIFIGIADILKGIVYLNGAVLPDDANILTYKAVYVYKTAVTEENKNYAFVGFLVTDKEDSSNTQLYTNKSSIVLDKQPAIFVEYDDEGNIPFPTMNVDETNFSGWYTDSKFKSGTRVTNIEALANQEGFSGVVYARYLGYGEAAVVSVICVLIVFSMLALLWGIVSLFKYIPSKDGKAEPAKPQVKQPVVQQQKAFTMDDIKDEDMMVAALVATIDYRNEVKEDVKVINVREVK